MNEKITLSKAAYEYIDAELKKYPADQRQSAVMAALMYVQKEQGYLSEPYMNAIADYLNMAPIAVYEVASFYTMYDHQPVGRNKVSICTNVSCMLRGAEELAEHVKNKLSIDYNGTTPDGRITLKQVECLGACIGAPAVMINDDYHEKLNHEKMDRLLDNLK